MPHNDSHIVDVETWWCNPGRQHKRKSITKKFHSKSGTKKSGVQRQPTIQLKFLSNHKSIVIEWGELMDANSEILPTLVGKGEDFNGKWNLKGKVIFKHDGISNVKVHNHKVVKLEVCIKDQPALRWGEQSWNTRTNRNNRTTWDSEASKNTTNARWPEQFKAVQSCKSIFVVPKQKHQKKLVFLVDQLSLDFSYLFRRSNSKRLNTDTTNAKLSLSSRELQQAAKVLQDDSSRTCDAREPLFRFDDKDDYLLLTPTFDPWQPTMDDQLLKVLPRLSPPTSPKFKRQSARPLRGAPKRLKSNISDVKLRDDTSLFKMRSLQSSKILANEIVNSSKATANETGARRCLNISGTASHVKRNQFNRTRSIRKSGCQL